MRSAALTGQGRGLLVGGLTVVGCALLLGERDLLRVGLVVVVLPLVAIGWVAASGRGLRAHRFVHRRTLEVGHRTRVELGVEHGGLPLSDVLLEDTHDQALGPRPRLRVPRLRRGTPVTAEYALEGRVRGVFDIGPLEAHVMDPFGLAVARHRIGETESVTVTPRLIPLPLTRLGASTLGAGDNSPHSFAVGNAADVIVREYRTGDDLRRVHWRSTARTGELMVRREEQPWQSRCTLLLEDRACAHRGTRSDSSLEVAITAAGSVAAHLSRQGFSVRMITASGVEVGSGWHDGASGATTAALLRELALLHRTDRFEIATEWIDESITQSLVIGVFGLLRPDDLAALQRLRRRETSALALAVDPQAWSRRSGDEAAAPALLATGWRAATVRHEADIATSWRELGR